MLRLNGFRLFPTVSRLITGLVPMRRCIHMYHGDEHPSSIHMYLLTSHSFLHSLVELSSSPMVALSQNWILTEWWVYHKDNMRPICSIKYSIGMHTTAYLDYHSFPPDHMIFLIVHCLMVQSQHDTNTLSNRDNHSLIFDRRSSAYTALVIISLSLFSILYYHLLHNNLVCLVFCWIYTSKGFWPSLGT